MKVIIKEPRKTHEIRKIENNLETYRKIINCKTIHVVQVPFNPDIAIILDDNGKLLGKTPNFWRYNDIIVGTVIFAGIDGEDLVDLTDEQINIINSYLKYTMFRSFNA